MAKSTTEERRKSVHHTLPPALSGTSTGSSTWRTCISFPSPLNPPNPAPPFCSSTCVVCALPFDFTCPGSACSKAGVEGPKDDAVVIDSEAESGRSAVEEEKVSPW